MASLHKQPGRPHYFCAYALADGKRVFRSTGTANEREAKRIMQSWVQAALEARSKDGLTVDRARQIIEHGVADIYRSGSGEAMPDSTLGSWIDRWLESKKLETTPATFVRYGNTIKGFKEALKNKLTKPISSITTQDILKWRDARGKVVAAKTINVDLKTIRALFGEAVRTELVTVNVASRVKVLKQSETSRRAFGVDEINRLIKMAVGEMKGLIIFGIFTGQRLGDIARLTWRSLDLDNNEIRFVTSKTGKRLAFPLLRPMADYVATLDVPNDDDAPIFPDAHAAVVKEGRVVTLSNQFHALLAVGRAGGEADARFHRQGTRSEARGRAGIFSQLETLDRDHVEKSRRIRCHDAANYRARFNRRFQRLHASRRGGRGQGHEEDRGHALNAPRKKGKFHKVSKRDASPAPQWIVEAAQKLSAAEKGSVIDPDALDIVRSVFIKKDFEKHSELRTMLRMYEKGGPMKNTLAILSPDGLVDADRQRILKAVCDFDRKFLKSLIKAMDLCENGSGLAQPNAFHLARTHTLYQMEHRTLPTVKQLQQFHKVQRGIVLDEKSIRFICKRDGLRISADKKGRPKLDS